MPNEWAQMIAKQIISEGPYYSLIERRIAAALIAAVAEQREVDARIAEEPITNPQIDLGSGYVSTCRAIAAAIRGQEVKR